MVPLVVDYLKDHSLQQLEDDHGVCARFSNDRTKASLNYDQILIRNGDRLAEQCRGMVVRVLAASPADDERMVRPVGHVAVVAWPMDRFYNHGDVAAAPVDWGCPRLRVDEKLDGTMIVLYHDADRWHVATRGVPEADLPIHAGHLEVGDMTFSELFWWALRCTLVGQVCAHAGDHRDWCIDALGAHLRTDITYVLELTSHVNQVVVRYESPGVTLLAARRTSTGEELHLDEIELPGVPRPRTWPLADAASVTAFVNNALPSELEGAVVIDGSFRRLKVKSKAWVMASRAKDSVTSSARNALEAIILEKADDIVPLLPSDAGDRLLRMQSAYVRYCRGVDRAFAAIKDASDGSRKDFAVRVSALHDWSAPYFALLDRRASTTREWVHGMCEGSRLSASALDNMIKIINEP